METLTLQCAIEQIMDWHPRLFLEPHIVACVAVLSRYSKSPAVLEVECSNIASAWLGQEKQFRLEVMWSDELAGKAERLRLTMQPKPLIELAAIALALILAYHVVNLGQLDVTAYGDRADYRSLDRPSVLEISGTEILSELARREREKIAQAVDNPLGLDAYVVVCGFAEDGHRIRFSYHHWKDKTGE
jgi:hypothetical protein